MVSARDGLNSDEAAEQPQWHPQRGWAVPTPATTPRAYVSGDAALNVPKLADDTDRDDWHEWGTWWSGTPAELDGTALEIELWARTGKPPAHRARPNCATPAPR